MSTTPRNPKNQNPGVDCSGANRVLMGMYHSECLCIGEGYVYHTKKPKKARTLYVYYTFSQYTRQLNIAIKSPPVGIVSQY